MIKLQTAGEIDSALHIINSTAHALATTEVKGMTLAEAAMAYAQVKKILDATRQLYQMTSGEIPTVAESVSR